MTPELLAELRVGLRASRTCVRLEERAGSAGAAIERTPLRTMPCRPRQPALGLPHLGDRKLLNLRWPLRLDSCGRHSFHEPRGEGIEVVAGLPEVDDSPATIDRPRRMEKEPFRWCAIGVGVIVSLVELLLSDRWELDADADSHSPPSLR